MLSGKTFATALLAAAPLALFADEEIDFNEFHAENIPADVIEAAIGVSSTNGLDGIALGPGDTLYVLHADESENKTLFLLDPTTDPATITVLATDADLKTDLGVTGTLIIEGGFTSSPDGEILYFFYSDSDDLNAEINLVAFDHAAVSPDPKAVVIYSGEDIEEVKDAATLANGNIVMALDDDGVGLLDLSTDPPTFSIRVTDADFVNDLINNHGFPGATDEGEAESIAVHPNGDVYVFLHEVEELYRITDIEGTPGLTRVVVPEWVPGDPDSLVTNAVDMHGMVFDSEGNLYGFDEGNEAIVIWDGDHGYVILLDDIHDELGHDHDKNGDHEHGDFEPAEYRGLAVRINAEGHPVLYMAMNNDDDGVVMVEFGDDHTSVSDWQLFN